MQSKAEMVLQGYRIGAPSQKAEDIDAAVAEQYPRRKCGGPMRYQGHIKRNGSNCEYVTLAVCDRCGHTVSF